MIFNEIFIDESYTDVNPMDTGFSSLFVGGFGVVFALFILVFVGIVVTGVVLGVRNYRKAKDAGVDIFTLQTDLAVKAANSQFLAPAQSKEQRLAELDSLKAKRVINDEEYTAARIKILSE